jgi:NDP-sugar pyrophosphorylase family protein
LDKEGHIVDLKMLIDMINSGYSENYVVLMAGGQGTRLRPLTEHCPKPMLKVGNKPIIETIIENLKEYGFYKFLISVNYKAQVIMDYLNNGSKLKVDIDYLKEKDELGTAGALSLIPFRPKDTLLVMNADLLTKVNFQQLFDFHKQQDATATMCVREYQFQVPYGVIKIKNQSIASVDEKPLHKFFVNAGIYALEPRALDFVPENQYFDMPNLFEKLIEEKQVTSAFPIREYWIDIGRPGDYKQANGEYCEVF